MSRILAGAKRGFTIIEISLFLAITGLIFIAMIIGVNSSLTQNHYEDDVRGLVDFIQNAYSKVISVEGDGKGDSTTKAIYGKLITFGESNNLAGTTNSNNSVFIYDVVGDIATNDSGSTLAALKALNANVTVGTSTDSRFAGIADSFTLRWASTIETTAAEPTTLKAAILITRSPSNGNIFTYVKTNGTLEINKNRATNPNILLNALNNNEFTMAELDICVSMDRKPYGGRRKDIRIDRLSRGSSGVRVIHLDEADNRCQNL